MLTQILDMLIVTVQQQLSSRDKIACGQPTDARDLSAGPLLFDYTAMHQVASKFCPKTTSQH